MATVSTAPAAIGGVGRGLVPDVDVATSVRHAAGEQLPQRTDG